MDDPDPDPSWCRLVLPGVCVFLSLCAGRAGLCTLLGRASRVCLERKWARVCAFVRAGVRRYALLLV